MSEMSVRLELAAGGDEELEEATRSLRRELADLAPVTDANRATAPPGTRALDPAELGALLVAVKPTADLLRALVTAARGWLSRARTPASIRLEIDGDVLDVKGTTTEEQRRLADEWIRLHSANRSERT